MPLECETLIKDHEQEFEKFYFVSMVCVHICFRTCSRQHYSVCVCNHIAPPFQKHLTKGQDLQNACVDIANLLEPARKVRAHLAAFGERLERTRERIEGAARLHHLLGLRLMDDDGIQQEMERLAHKIGVPGLVEMCRRDSAIGKSATTTVVVAVSEALAVGGTARPLCTSTPIAVARADRLPEQPDRTEIAVAATADDSTDYVTANIAVAENSQQQQPPDAACHCWRESSSQSQQTSPSAEAAAKATMPETVANTPIRTMVASNFQSNRSSSDDEENDDDDEYDYDDDDEGEEDHSKMADSGLGYCERCEGQGKMTRACSCQSFDDPTNTSSKRYVVGMLKCPNNISIISNV